MAAAAPVNKPFAVHMWDCFDAVYDRLTVGRHDLKRIKAYLEERALAEDMYGKALAKCSAPSPETDMQVPSTLSSCWKDIRGHAVSLSKQHIQFAVVCTQVAEELEKTVKNIKEVKSKLQRNHNAITLKKKNAAAAWAKAKQSYYDAVKQAETAVLNRDAGKSQNLTDKQLSKLEKIVKSTAGEVDKLHAAYEKSVLQLQQIEEQFDKEAAENLTKFEELELDRLNVLKAQLERFAQSHEFLKNSLDQMIVMMDQGVHAISVSKDMDDFVTQKSIGSKPGPHVQYVPCRSEILSHALDAPPIDPVAQQQHQAAVSGSPVQAPLQAHAQALYDFDSKQPGDLSFKKDDMIVLTSYPEGEDWWTGQLNGRVGVFPKNYTKLVQQPMAGGGGGGGPPPAGGKGSPAAGPANGTPAPAAAPADGPKVVHDKVTALYDFSGQDNDELSFKKGDTLIITGELNGWYLGRTLVGDKVGIFPSNYVYRPT